MTAFQKAKLLKRMDILMESRELIVYPFANLQHLKSRGCCMFDFRYLTDRNDFAIYRLLLEQMKTNRCRKIVTNVNALLPWATIIVTDHLKEDQLLEVKDYQLRKEAEMEQLFDKSMV